MLGAVFEADDNGDIDIGFPDEQLWYAAPATLRREDMLEFESQLRDLIEHERDYRRKWCP